MKRYLLTIAYCGTRFCGWQVQPNGNSVQAELCAAAEKIFGLAVNITGCSRTDSGVHARMFCCHFDAETKLSPDKIRDAFQFYTCSDITVYSCKTVENDFHSRYNCLGKTYVYRILNSRFPSPFEREYAYHYKYPLSLERMNEAAALLVGKHDFSAFCSVGSSVEDKVRTVSECNASKKGDIVEITVTGDGFLYNMVRIIAGTLIEAGNNRRSLDSIERALTTGERSFAGFTAPPQGLFLEKVNYKEEVECG